MKQIKAILFDSGNVLNSPVTNHWFITPNFWNYVERNKFDNVSKNRISYAFDQANKYISEQKSITTKEEEYLHFVKFYEIFSSALPDLDLNDKDIENIAKDLVFNTEKYVFFDDALDVIPTLYGKYKLAVVSDAWPSLSDVFEKNGMITYFESFVISSIIGVTKPDRKMYVTALEELNVAPDEAIFIDDNLKNCKGAIDCGINAIFLCQSKKQYIVEKIKSIGKEYKIINNLYRLENLIK